MLQIPSIIRGYSKFQPLAHTISSGIINIEFIEICALSRICTLCNHSTKKEGVNFDAQREEKLALEKLDFNKA